LGKNILHRLWRLDTGPLDHRTKASPNIYVCLSKPACRAVLFDLDDHPKEGDVADSSSRIRTGLAIALLTLMEAGRPELLLSSDIVSELRDVTAPKR